MSFTPFNVHGNLPADVFVGVLREQRKVTVRVFAPFADQPLEPLGAVNDYDIDSETFETIWATHNDALGPQMQFSGKPIHGGLLSPDLSDTLFNEVHSVTLDLDQGLGSGELTDRSIWSIGMKRFPLPWRLTAPRMRLIDTKESKIGVTDRYLGLQEMSLVAQIWMPFKDSNLDECGFLLNFNPTYGYRANFDIGDFKTHQELVDHVGFEPYFDATLSGPATVAAGGTVAVNAAIHMADDVPIAGAAVELRLETTAGYLPKQRVVTVDGQATFNVTALGLSAGDVIRVKVGVGHFTGMDDHTITVV